MSCKHLIYYPGTIVALSASIGIWIKQYILYSFGERGIFFSMGGLITSVSKKIAVNTIVIHY